MREFSEDLSSEDLYRYLLFKDVPRIDCDIIKGMKQYTTMSLQSTLKSICVHLRLPIALEASLRKSLSLNQLAKIFVARGMWGDKHYSYFTLCFSLVATSK